MSRKTKKLRINKKKVNNKKKNKRRTRKIYGGVTLNNSLQPSDTLYKYNPLPYNETFTVKIIGVASNITGNKNLLDESNPDVWYLVAFKNGVYKKEISGHTLKPSKDWLTSWSIAPETYNQNSIAAINEFFGTGNTIRKLYNAEEIDTDSKLQFINTVIKNNSAGYLSDTLDTIVRKLEAKREVEVAQFIAEPPKNPFDENDEDDSLVNEAPSPPGEDDSLVNEDDSLLQGKIVEEEKKQSEANDIRINEGKLDENTTTKLLPVSRFSKLPSLPKFSGISFPSRNKTLKNTPEVDIKNKVRELEAANINIENKVRELRNALMLPLPKEPQMETIVEVDETAEIDGGAKNDEELKTITTIKEIIAQTPGVLTDADITKIEDLLKNIPGDSFKKEVAIINEIVSESKKYNVNTIQIETLAKAVATPIINPKPSADTTVGPLQPEPVKASSPGIFNKLKNFTQKKRPVNTVSPPVALLEDHAVLASSFVTLANALSPDTTDKSSDTIVQVPKVEKDLLEAIDKIRNDNSCFADENRITGTFYNQLEAYKKTYAKLTVADMRSFGELEPGLRKRILECTVEIKKAAQIVLADYEKRSSALLSTKDRLFNRFTRKNSGKDSEISDILDRVKDASGDELETIIYTLRDALSKPDDKQVRFDALDRQITQYKVLLASNQKELSAATEDVEKEVKKKIADIEKTIADKTKEKDNVKSTIEENVDLILYWLKTEREHSENLIKAKQIELKKGKSPAEKVVINDDIKKSTDRIALLKKNERDVFSIKGLKNIKTANNRTLKQRLFGDKEKDSEASDSGEKLGFNNKSEVVINPFNILDQSKEFVPIVIEGDEIYINNIRIDGSGEVKRQEWNKARGDILGLEPQKGNTLPSFDAGKLTFKVYKRGKVSIQLNDGPVVYINNKAELEKFKDDSRKPTQKPSLLSRISNPFKNMFGSNNSSKKEEEEQENEEQDQEEGGVEGLSEEGEQEEGGVEGLSEEGEQEEEGERSGPVFIDNGVVRSEQSESKDMM
jgi:hypothetical protein